MGWLGTILLKIASNLMIMLAILCCVYCYGAKLGLGVSIAFILCCSVRAMLSNWIGMFWERIGFLVQCLCAWNSARTCNSRSGEPGLPRRDMQGLVFLPYSRLSPRRRISGLGERSSCLGEWVSPKREFERVGNSVWHPAQAGIPIFWAKECLAQARASRLARTRRMFCCRFDS